MQQWGAVVTRTTSRALQPGFKAQYWEPKGRELTVQCFLSYISEVGMRMAPASSRLVLRMKDLYR
jgi:hypothetical protein